MKQKYIVGDWVKFAGAKAQVQGVKGDTIFLSDIAFDEKTNGYVDVNDVEGIPLTPEILEKNGWEWDDEDYILGALVIYPEADYFIFDGFGTKLRYVSDLQHLLFGLGLESDMIV